MHELPFSLDTHPTRKTPKASFLTLTYSEAHLRTEENPHANLDKRDWQLFAKRLRDQAGPFRFLMCGEYGDKRDRRHLHAIIFGHDFREDRVQTEKTNQGYNLFVSPLLDHAWGKGRHTIGDVSFDTISYVAGYINKKVNGEKADKHYRRINPVTGQSYAQVPEFALASRNKGLGNQWIEKYHPEVYPRDEVIINGERGTPPNYYDRWYKENYPSEYEELTAKRLVKAKENAQDNTPERLAVKERVFKSKYANYKRRAHGGDTQNP